MVNFPPMLNELVHDASAFVRCTLESVHCSSHETLHLRMGLCSAYLRMSCVDAGILFGTPYTSDHHTRSGSHEGVVSRDTRSLRPNDTVLKLWIAFPKVRRGVISVLQQCTCAFLHAVHPTGDSMIDLDLEHKVP